MKNAIFMTKIVGGRKGEGEGERKWGGGREPEGRGGRGKDQGDAIERPC